MAHAIDRQIYYTIYYRGLGLPMEIGMEIGKEERGEG